MEWEEDWQELEWETVVNKRDKRILRELRELREDVISREQEKILSEQKSFSREKKVIERVKKTILREQKAVSREIAVKEVKLRSKESRELKTFANNLTRGGRRVKTKTKTRETEILLYMRKINESNENVQANLSQTPQMCLLWNSITWSYSPIHI